MLERFVAARVGGNDRDMTFADRVYLRRVIGTVHEVVEVRDPAGCYGGQGYGDLGVVQGSEDSTERDPAACRYGAYNRVSRIPRAFSFVPRSQTFGRSSSIASKLMRPPAA